MLLFFVLLLNVGIAYWNAVVCGKAWREANALGGWGKALVWCGAIQSVIGFSSAYAFLVAIAVGGQFGHAVISLWYVLIIIPALGSGLVLTIHSWIEAYRERSLSSMAVAGWNTFAQVENVANASSGIGEAFSNIGDFFGSSDSDDDASSALTKLALIVAVIIILGASIGTTYVIMKNYIGTLPVPSEA